MMRNKSTFAGVLLGLLLMVVCCGTVQADPMPHSGWTPVNDSQQNGLDISFGRRPKDSVIYIEIRNRYNVAVIGEILVDVVNNLDGTVRAGELVPFEMKPNEIDAGPGNWFPIPGDIKTTNVSLKNIRIKRLLMALPSDPTGQEWEVYPDNQLAKHQQQQRDDAAAKAKQQADDARQKQEAEQKQQQQERQRQIDAEKQRVHDAQQRQLDAAKQNLANVQQGMRDAAQASADAETRREQAKADLNQQSFRGQREDTPEIKRMLRDKKYALSAAIDDEAHAEQVEANGNGSAGSAAIGVVGAAYFRNKAQTERDKAADLDRKIERAREDLANQNDDNSQGSGDYASPQNIIPQQPTVNYFDLGFQSDIAGDYTTAMKYYQQAAEQGNASAMAKIGALYYNGSGVPKDEETAIIWYKKAATLGNQTANDFLNTILAKLRFDGVYTGKFESKFSDDAEYFLRFFADGTVMQYVNDGNAKDISWAWTNKLKAGTKEHAVSVTHYQLTGNTVTMDFPKSALGGLGATTSYRTSYDGKITWVGLQLNWKQWEKHDKTGEETFTFTPIK